MKTARERAAEFIREHMNGMHEPYGPMNDLLVSQLMRPFAKERMRDQRYMCADACSAANQEGYSSPYMSRVALNAPEPPEQE